MSSISERQKLYIGLGMVLFIVAAIFLGGMFVGYQVKERSVPACPECDKLKCPADLPCPIADHEAVDIILYPTASVACNKAPESDKWLCSPVVFKDPDGEPGKIPREVTVRLLESPETAAKKDKEQ